MAIPEKVELFKKSVKKWSQWGEDNLSMEPIPQKIDKTTSENLSAIFKKRAVLLDKQANFMLVLIIILLSLGSTVFLLAAKITAIDIASTDTSAERYEKAKSLLIDKEAELTSTDEKIRGLREKIAPGFNNLDAEIWKKVEASCESRGSTTSMDPLAIELEAKNFKPVQATIVTPRTTHEFYSSKKAIDCSEILKSSLQGKIDFIFTSAGDSIKQISLMDKKRDNLREEIKVIKIFSDELRGESIKGRLLKVEGKGEIEKLNGKPKGSNAVLSTFLQTNVTRFGSLLIVFFLVNILLSQYRYNLKLSAYYSARADALSLEIDNLTTDSLYSLFNALTPTVDFGKTPKAPVEQLIELTKDLKDIVKRKP